MGEEGAHAPVLERLGLEPPAVAALGRYLDLVAAWNPRVNLTGARTAEQRVAVLVAPVLPVAAVVEHGPLLDIGSGSGSPGLVLALLRRDLPVTLLEPRQRRWAFLREAARVGGRFDLTVLRARHDAYKGPAACSVTVRALSLPLADIAPLLVPGGRVLIWGQVPADVDRFRPEADPAPGVHAYRLDPGAGVSRST